MTPRMQWLRERVKEVVAELHKLETVSDYIEYKKMALDLSIELNYAVTEWERYYNET